MNRLPLHNAILVDEVGIESGCVDGLLLKSAYQPIFAPAGDRLRMVALEAVTEVQRDGRLCSLAEMPNALHGLDPDSLAELCQTLHLDNHRNLSVSGCDLLIGHDLAHNARLVRAFLSAVRHARASGEPPLMAHQVICRIEGGPLESNRQKLLEELRAAGFRLALAAFDGDEGGGAPARFPADIAEITGPWLAKVAAENGMARLLRPLMEAHRRKGTRLLVRAIATTDQLRLALAAGADYLAGDYLALPALAGTLIDEEPKPIADLLRPPLRIVLQSA